MSSNMAVLRWATVCSILLVSTLLGRTDENTNSIQNAANDQKAERTYNYLKSVVEIVDRSVNKINRHPFGQPPAAPAHPSAPTLAAQAEQEYIIALDQCVAGCITNCQRFERVFNDAQIKISNLDSSRVDNEAVAIAVITEVVMGDTVQCFTALRQLFLAVRDEMHQGPNSNLKGDVLAGLIAGFTLGPEAGVLKFVEAASEDDRKQIANQSETLRKHLERVRGTVETLEQDSGKIVARKCQAITILRSRYPGTEWASFLPAEQHGP